MAERSATESAAQVQRSFREGKAAQRGTLYLVGTPIGNLEDMTYRAVHILKEVDWIAAEDTRQTRKLLTHFDIQAKLLSYHEHNKRGSGEALLAKLLEGESVALVSDAGLPAISDPGADLAAAAIESGVPVVPVPGANAALTALIASGLPPAPFVFIGFLPRDKKKSAAELDRWRRTPATLILYEAPHRVEATLQLLQEGFGSRRCVLARELTKRYEEFARGTIAECLEFVRSAGAKGEYVLLVEGADDAAANASDEPNWWEGLSASEHIAAYEARDGLTAKEALKRAAVDRNVPKRELYREIHRGEQG